MQKAVVWGERKFLRAVRNTNQGFRSHTFSISDRSTSNAYFRAQNLSGIVLYLILAHAISIYLYTSL
ncbi:5101_t:CDS:2 [Ambispora leptoticha]|uniref:5101_t:CDS:1 n=1 Tax=Ambispora leptoticha TaxID=144679 RepID=A0A9N8Z866_9GLOM|nr:5101_t:CDS:2 [Ambispora leptoticha]